MGPEKSEEGGASGASIGFDRGRKNENVIVFSIQKSKKKKKKKTFFSFLDSRSAPQPGRDAPILPPRRRRRSHRVV